MQTIFKIDEPGDAKPPIMPLEGEESSIDADWGIGRLSSMPESQAKIYSTNSKSKRRFN